MPRYGYVIAGSFLLYLLFSFVFISLAPVGYSSNGQAGIKNISGMNISAAINYTKAYLLNVNDSAYLVFYPNNAKAYSYLTQAENTSKNNSVGAYALLNKAISYASQQRAEIYKYRTVSIVTMAVLAVIFGIILFKLMFALVKKPKRIKGK